MEPMDFNTFLFEKMIDLLEEIYFFFHSGIVLVPNIFSSRFGRSAIDCNEVGISKNTGPYNPI